MGSLDQPPEILGEMIGSALVGTFLGVFLAYGLMGPFAARVKPWSRMMVISTNFNREVLVANLHHDEVGRQNTLASCGQVLRRSKNLLRALKQEAA